MKFKRIIMIVLDSVGIGALPDAGMYGDQGANTLGNIARRQGGLSLPVLSKLGLSCIEEIQGVPVVAAPLAGYGKMAEISKGKDTTSGHWEMAGCPVFDPFPVYPAGFPVSVMEAFIDLTGCRGILGNKAASGTAILEELGAEHIQTGYPIIYTSADSVFQIAAHEEVIPLMRLYELCAIAREQVCVGQHAVGRIIARPFVGNPGNFTRTANRHDYSLEPVLPTLLDILKAAGHSVIGVGKIADIFAKRGICQSYSTKSNDHGMAVLLSLVAQPDVDGFIMANLVEFDSNFGHRRDTLGYARALERFDAQLALLLPALGQQDLLLLTADHGCDPTAAGTDHTREYVPLLAFSPASFFATGAVLGIRTTFADVSATVADNFDVNPLAYGQSFLPDITQRQ